MSHVHTLGHALIHGAIVAVVDHDPESAIAFCEEAAVLANKHDMDLWRGYGDILHGYAHVLTSEIEPAAILFRRGLSLLQKTQTETMVPVHRAVYAVALARLGRAAEATSQVALVHHELTEGSERYFHVEALLWLGQYQLAGPMADDTASEALALRGLEEARRQDAIAWEIRAATAVGRFRKQRGEHAAARDLVAPLLKRLPEVGRSRLRLDAEFFLDS